MHHTHEDSHANARARLVNHVHELERLTEIRAAASDDLRYALNVAKSEGFDATTLRVVLRLRKMTPNQRRERRALEAIYMAALGMLDGDSLPDEARRRLDDPEARKDEQPQPEQPAAPRDPATRQPEQPPLIVKDPAEARQEGLDAAAAGKRIYDNPYGAGDPARAAWDEGWCAQSKSNGMETPKAYQRRTESAEKKDGKDDKDNGGAEGDSDQRGAA
jgi:uncharacterized protein (UPF0335 family)